MELINPYSVMRNTATYEAYRTYARKAAMAGQPFLALGGVMSVFLPMGIILGGRVLHRSPIDGKWLLAAFVAWFSLSGLLMAAGFIRMARYRREHPIPDEWRQIPRIQPSRMLGRTRRP